MGNSVAVPVIVIGVANTARRGAGARPAREREVGGAGDLCAGDLERGLRLGADVREREVLHADRVEVEHAEVEIGRVELGARIRVRDSCNCEQDQGREPHTQTGRSYLPVAGQC